MRKHIIVSAVFVGLAVSLFFAASVQAQLYNPDVDLPKPTGMEKSLTKMGRGISNIVFGWAEVPVTFDRNLKKGKPLGYLVGVAPVLGSARAVMRTGTGVFETLTFPFSDKDVNFNPVLEPEFLF
ncbi:MAG: exosortase system-associated protein, TIGR04073 family [Candidatus Hydrogenedens sp.]|jgi:putative exosortase-associated protein (TIGR04073 family)|nr:exosortase system-associated protein, TIGR04073 family [Candidatus Hydrogenedens sp.]